MTVSLLLTDVSRGANSSYETLKIMSLTLLAAHLQSNRRRTDLAWALENLNFQNLSQLQQL